MSLIIVFLIFTIIILFIYHKIKSNSVEEDALIYALETKEEKYKDIIAELTEKQEKLVDEVIDVRQDLANSFKKTMDLEDTIIELELYLKKYKRESITLCPEVLKVFNQIVSGHVFEKLGSGYHVEWYLWSGSGHVTSNHKSLLTKDELYDLMLNKTVTIHMDSDIDPDFHFPQK